MPEIIKRAVYQFSRELKRMLGNRLVCVVLYGSYARGTYHDNSDVDIMILLDLSDMDIKAYRHQLSDMTFDFNMNYDTDIKPIAKSEEHFHKWIENYPFYTNVNKEGVTLYAA